MKFWLPALIGVIAFAPAHAAELTSLYTAQVPFEQDQQDARAAAYDAALRQVLMRVSGPDLATDTSLYESLFPDPSVYVVQFQPGPDDTLLRHFRWHRDREDAARVEPDRLGRRPAAHPRLARGGLGAGRAGNHRRRGYGSPGRRRPLAQSQPAAARTHPRNRRRAWPAGGLPAARQRGHGQGGIQRRMGRLRRTHRRGVRTLRCEFDTHRSRAGRRHGAESLDLPVRRPATRLDGRPRKPC